MPEFQKIHRVNHTAENMFDLVADVEKYPEFVPLCRSLKIRSSRTKGDNQIILADMCVAYKLVSETFTSQVVLKKNELRIDVQYIDGPFKFLRNVWKFEPLIEKECDISFFIEYEFKSRALGLLMGSMFDYAFSRFTTAFEERANEIYNSSNLIT